MKNINYKKIAIDLLNSLLAGLFGGAAVIVIKEYFF